MKYEFIKTIYEYLDGIDIEACQNMAYSMIQYGKDRLGNERFSKYYYNSVVDALKLVKKKYGKGQELPWEDSELSKELSDKNVKKDQCIFLTFFIMEIKERIIDAEKKEGEQKDLQKYRNEYCALLNQLYRCSGMDALINSSMENAILYFSVATHQPWKVWVDMQEEWSTIRKKDEKWHKKYAEWRSLTYSELKERVREGLGESTKATQYTYLEADQSMIHIIDEYNIENYKKQRKDIAPVKASGIFAGNIQTTLEHAEWRRTWYLYRMFFMVIDCQIEELLENAKKRKCSESRKEERCLENRLERCWLKTNYVTVEKIISSAADEDELERKLRGYFDNCRLTAENIAEVFNESLVEHMDYMTGGRVFVQAKHRFKRYFEDKMERYLSGSRDLKTSGILYKYFKSNKEVENVFKGISCGSVRNARLFCKLMSGEVVTSKEMLLLTALIAKKQGSQEINKDYVYNHILKNTRFDMNLNQDREFDRFFLDSFQHIEKLQENAVKLERTMLEAGKGAVFYNIIRGKELEA